MAFRSVVFALTSHTKVQARITTRKAMGKDQKGKAMKPFVLNPDSHSLKYPLKKVMAMLGNRI